jgi:hypothetical protein
VTDTGAGMTREFILERLFKPFDTTKGSKGMGIGAYQVREYVQSLGGRVEVRSEPGKGTRMSLRFPLSTASDLEADLGASPPGRGGQPERGCQPETGCRSWARQLARSRAPGAARGRPLEQPCDGVLCARMTVNQNTSFRLYHAELFTKNRLKDCAYTRPGPYRSFRG